MATTYEAIATVTVGSGGAASMDFQNIPQTYTDLSVLVSARTNRTTGGVDGLGLEINGLTTNRSWRRVGGNGATIENGNQTSIIVAYIPQAGGSTGWTANVFASVSLYFPNYAGSTNKSFSVDATTENNATTSYTDLWAQLWSNSSAITRLTFKSSNGLDFVQYSTATLYGIKNS